MSLKSSKIDSSARDSKFEKCSAFLTDKLGFAPERINRRVIEHVAHSLSENEVSGEKAQAAIIAAATVGETYFFRHRSQFDWIEQTWLPQWLKRRKARLRLRPLRVLSAGCASGEEAYTLAAVLWRTLADKRVPVEVVAFDVNDEFLERAQVATYGLWSLRGVQIEEESDWLTMDGSTISVRPEIRDLVRFTSHNLLEPLDTRPELSQPFDLIFCRNVLIYFHDKAVHMAYENLEDALCDDGILVVGPSDPNPPEILQMERRWDGGIRSYAKSPGVAVGSISKDLEESPTPTTTSSPSEKNESSSLQIDDHPEQSPVEAPSSKTFSCVDASSVARRLSRLSSTELACDFLRHHLAEHPLDVEGHVLLAVYCTELDQCEEAFEWGRRAVFLAPDAPYVIFVLSDICGRCQRDVGQRRYTKWASDLLEKRKDDGVLKYSNGCTVAQLKEVLDVDPK